MTLKYHLSSSPPDFEVLSLNWLDNQHNSFHSAVIHKNCYEPPASRKTKSFIKKKPKNDTLFETKEEFEDFKSPIEMFKDSRFETTKDCLKDIGRIANWEQHYNCLEESKCTCKNSYTSKSTKKVLFADQLGKELEEVKVASESTDMPPRLSEKTLQSIMNSLSDSPLHLLPPCSHKTFTLNLKNFTLPHLDLLSLDRRIQQVGLALSSISLQLPCILKCMVETRRNIPCDSTVSVRYTLDEWRTMQEVQGVCLSSDKKSSHHFYSFEIAISPTHHSVHVEFAINLKSIGTDIWDNNDQHNYRVHLSAEPPSPLHKASLHPNSSSPRHQPSPSLHENSLFLEDLQILDSEPQAFW